MKQILWLLFFSIAMMPLTAQKSKVLSAYNFLQAYHSSKDCGELAGAVEAIELALTHEVTSEWSKTWYYRGDIFFAVYTSEDHQCRELSEPALDVAYDSYMKSIQRDEKQRYIKEIEPKISVIASFYLQRGAVHFNVKKYDLALGDFEKAVEVARYFRKIDTVALYNAALSSEKLKNYSKAALYYEGLIDIGYRDARIYHFLSQAYLELADTAKSFQAIKAGRIAYPENHDLIIDELNHYLADEQTQLAMENLDKAIEQMPENAELFFAKGTIMDKIGDWDQAKAAYETALKIKPDYFNANYNLGALYFNKGVEYVDLANTFGENQTVKFKEAEKNSALYFGKALPYLEKANQLDPHDRPTLLSLKNLYSRMSDEEGYRRVSGILDN